MRILIVEDEPLLADGLSRSLKQAGYAVDCLDDGQAADTLLLSEQYDCVILDPPSFARGNQGSFSTAKDLRALHELALDVVAPDGVLATSINSANVSRAKFEAELLSAAKAKGRALEVLEEISQPDTFPSRLGDVEGRYLKGWILRVG